MTKVINFFGGPGAGKTTLGGELFGYMKRQRRNTEYVPEFARELTRRRAWGDLENQMYVLGEQHHRQYSNLGTCDYIISDSPIVLGMYYVRQQNDKVVGQEKFKAMGPKWGVWLKSFDSFVINTFNMYDNINFLVDRSDRQYVQDGGRVQSEEEAKEIDKKIKHLLTEHNIPYIFVKDLSQVTKILGV